MISVHNFIITLTGCIIVYSKLDKKVNEECRFNVPTTTSIAWERAGMIVDRVKWRREEVLCMNEDLQRQKRSLNLMLVSYASRQLTTLNTVSGTIAHYY